MMQWTVTGPDGRRWSGERLTAVVLEARRATMTEEEAKCAVENILEAALAHKDMPAAQAWDELPPLRNFYEEHKVVCERDHGSYPDDGDIAERLRWWLPKSMRHGSLTLEDDIAEAAAALAARAAQAGDELPPFDDAAVQTVCTLLCSNEGPIDPAEHWEGWVARRIVAALAARGAQAGDELPPPLSDERILHLWDTHVGEPTACRPLVDADKINFARALAARGAQAEQPWPAGLLDRVKAAEQRIRDNHAPRRIPADPTDVDLVLAEVRALIEQREPPFWLARAALKGQPA